MENEKPKPTVPSKEPKGTSTEALINTNFSVAGQKEKGIELLGSFVNLMSSGDINKIQPMIIAVKDGQLIVEKVIVDEHGKISLPELTLNTREDLDKKSKFVRKILKTISPVLQAEIDNVTYVALMRKDQEKLQNMFEAIQTGTKPKLENRLGCIWLIVGDYEIVL